MQQAKTYTDKELIAGCLRNDRQFQELLYRKYFAAMWRMVSRYTQDRQAAQEIINNGFLRAFKKLHSFSHKGSLEGWLRKLVFHSLSEYFKQHNKYLQLLVFDETSVANSHSTKTESALHHLYFEDLMKLIQTLPPATRQVFELYAIQGFSHMEIANQVNISIGTSKWHLSTARKQLQQLLITSTQY